MVYFIMQKTMFDFKSSDAARSVNAIQYNASIRIIIIKESAKAATETKKTELNGSLYTQITAYGICNFPFLKYVHKTVRFLNQKRMLQTQTVANRTQKQRIIIERFAIYVRAILWLKAIKNFFFEKLE